MNKAVLCGMASVFFAMVPLEKAGGTESPLDAAAGMSGQGLDGDWLNVDAKSRGLEHVVIAGRQIRPFGACHPTACDWGWLHGQGFASKVDRHDTFALMATSDTALGRSVLTATLDPDGRLRVQVLTHYEDGSGRSDTSFVDYFMKQ